MELLPIAELSASRDSENLIKASEGLRLKSYPCGANKWSIGWGSTRGVGPNMIITEKDARVLLRRDIAESEDIVKDVFRGQLMSQGRFDALVSFAFNFGPKIAGYSIARMVRDTSIPAATIAQKFLEFQYTKRDDDGDGDIDAVIDDGLPIRRHREALMFLGYSFQVASAVVTRESLKMVEDKIPWVGGGHKEIHLAKTPLSELEHKARVMANFLEDPLPDQVDADLFDEPTEMQVLQYQSAQSAGYDGTIEEFVGHRKDKVRITKLTPRVPIDAVDYLENDGPPKVKRIEDSQRGKGYAKTTTGKEVGVAGVVGTGAVAVGAVEPVVAFVDKYPKETIAWVFALMMVFGLVYYFYGQWQRQKGEDEATDLLG